MKVVWLASYPRSGNTFLRTILWQCFGLRSASIYTDDLGGNQKLEEYVGHIKRGPNKQLRLSTNNIPLLKTHEAPPDNSPAIYVIRDGRAVAVSLWQFYDKALSLEKIIDGQHQFGTWSEHVQCWSPWNRPNTLLLKYENMRDDLPATLGNISEFLKCDIKNQNIPDRNAIAEADGQWVKVKKSWRSELSGDLLECFNQTHKDMLEKAGYL